MSKAREIRAHTQSDRLVKLDAVTDWLKSYDGPEVRIMEVCGTHTAAIFKSGLRSLLPPGIRLISGPGCPVCVTPAAYIDKCAAYAKKDRHVLMSFGDMLNVPGKNGSLSSVKGEGGNVEIMYSPMEALEKAARNPGVTYVIAAVGFETTAPLYGLLLSEASARGIDNLLLVTALKTVIPAIERIAGQDSESAGKAGRIGGFICPGHVSVVTGTGVYERLAERYKRPFVIAGFEAEHILAAVYLIMRRIEEIRGGEKARAENLYPSAVKPEGNPAARRATEACFETGAAVWRGLGEIENSGYYLREEYVRFDGGSRIAAPDDGPPSGCECGGVITGAADPPECPMFARECTPQTPRGPCMVSAEGTCGIWYRSR